MEEVVSKIEIAQGKFIDPLVGKFFHTYNGKVLEWQGKILALSNAGYVCQLYEWIVGDESDQVIVKPDAVSSWKFYDSADDWKLAYDRYSERIGRPTSPSH